MRLKFTKMQGIGNDYIYFSAFGQEIPNPETLAVKLSDRHFGIGGDGVIIIAPSEKADARMRMFNSDGSEGKMCGNGIRCVGKFVYERLGIKKTMLTIETLSGIKTLKLTVKSGIVTSICVDMGIPSVIVTQIPMIYPEDCAINAKIEGVERRVTAVSMGNPHAVTFVENTDCIDVEKEGRQIEIHKAFPQKTNVEFVEVVNRQTLKMRVWERGSGETLACGTGACASVVAAVLNGYCEKNRDIKVKLLGGELMVNYADTVYMIGGAEFVFDGEVEI